MSSSKGTAMFINPFIAFLWVNKEEEIASILGGNYLRVLKTILSEQPVL
jgi:hypothetical protein